MRNQYQILAEKYSQVHEISGGKEYSSTDLDKVAKLFYTTLRDTSMGTVPAIMEEIIRNIRLMARGPEQAEYFFDYIMNGIVKLAQAQNRLDVLRKFTDMSKIMKAGLGMHKPGLNEQSQVSETLDREADMFADPETELSIEVDDDDRDNGVLNYMGYKFPLSKTIGPGRITYFVGDVATGKSITVANPDQFSKVIAAIDRGEIKPAKETSSSIFSKVQRAEPGQMVTVYYPNRRIPGEYIEKERVYMTNDQAEKYILDMYRKHGNKIFRTSEEGDNPLHGYATDNMNYTSEYSRYWDLTRWMSKMNLADYRGGFKGANIVGKRSK